MPAHLLVRFMGTGDECYFDTTSVADHTGREIGLP
jgi:hypothetical protein